MNHTTQRFSRTSRGSGTEYAASSERSRRTPGGVNPLAAGRCIRSGMICHLVFSVEVGISRLRTMRKPN